MVCLFLTTNVGTYFTNTTGMGKVYAEETTAQPYVDYLSKAEELGTPLAVYNYLKNSINYEHYKGIRKGSEAVYDSLGGNDADQAILLSEMLEHLGYETRFVQGKIKLTQEQLASITGETDLQSAVDVFAMGTDASVMYDDLTGELCARLDHIWVEAYVPYGDYRGSGANSGEYLWLPLDTGIKSYKETETVYEHLDEYEATEEGIGALIEENPDLYLVNRVIVKEELPYLPLSLQYEVCEISEKSDTLDNVSQDSITFRLDGKNLGKLTPAELYNKRLTVNYYENGNAYKAQLLLDGTVIAEGNNVSLGAQQTFTMDVYSSGQTVTIDNTLTAGGMYQITTDTQNITSRELESAYDALEKLDDSVNKQNVLSEEYLGALLDVAGKAYYGQVDVANRMMEEQMDIHVSRSLSVGMTGYIPCLQRDASGNYTKTENGNFYIDIDLDAHKAVGDKTKVDEFMLLSGMISSSYENIIWEQLTGIPAVSTMAVLNEAIYEDTELVILTKENFASKKDSLEHRDEVLSAMEKATMEGYIVIVPQTEQSILDWQGSGYMILDPESRAGQYMISGGLNGGASSEMVELAYLVNIFTSVIDFSEALALLPAVGTAFAIGGPVGIIGGIGVSLVIIILACFASDNYVESIEQMNEYLDGNTEVGEEIVRDAICNVVIAGTVHIGASATKTMVKKMVGEKLTKELGQEAAEKVMKESDNYCRTYLNIDKLQKAGVTNETIASLSQENLEKLTKISKKGLAPEFLETLGKSDTALKNVADVQDLVIFKDSKKSSETIVHLLEEHGDNVVKYYKTYSDEAIDVFEKYDDLIKSFPTTNKDEAIELLFRYGDDVSEGLTKHYDDFMSRYMDEGQEFIDEYLELGDEVFNDVSDLELKIQVYIEDIVDDLGNINSTKMNDLKLAVQKGTFTKEEISLLSRKMSELGITEAYETAMKEIDFGKYLRNVVGEPPADMINPHAHHILFKTGNGEKQQQLVKEGQEILRKYGIDPIVGLENLVWAPNGITGQHDIAALTDVVDVLKAVDEAGGDYDDIVEALELMGRKASSRQ